MEELNDLLEQLHTLLDDYIELLDMDKDTSDIEAEIDSRVRALKIKTREQIEKSFDIPLILDGALLTFEKAIKRKRYLKNEDDSIRDKVNVKTDGDREYYYYLEKEVYHFDVEEENLKTAIKFVNSKREWHKDTLKDILDAIARICVISYGYRLTFETSIEKRLNVEKIYTGTVFNNSSYSSKTYNLLDKLFQKIAEDYIKRVKSSYEICDYVIHKVEDRWLIINRQNGSTDILNSEESEICEVANNVTECFDEDNVLRNNKNTDVKIEKLQTVVEGYIRRKKANN